MPSADGDDPLPPAANDPPAARFMRAAAEAVLLSLVVLSPWPFGCVQPAWELALFGGVAVLALLWAAHIAITGRFRYRPDPVSACLLGLILLTAFQLVPLPDAAARVIAPGVAGWRRDLQPDAPELLPGESGAAVAPSRPAAYPLTADPPLTRGLLVRLAAAAVVFLAARNLIASKDSFRRLAWAGFGLGLVLGVFAVGQAASSGRQTIYGAVDAGNEAFGPFVNKNDYPFAVNLCAGLGVGLLLTKPRRRRDEYGPDAGDPPGWGGAALASPRAVGLAAGLGLMLATVPFSLSRGGALATLVAGAVTALVLRGGRGAAAGGAFAAVGAAAVGLAAWFGTEKVGPRLGSVLTEGKKDQRWAMWRDTLRAVPGSPLFGTGGGAFRRVEPLFRDRPEPPTLVWEHAHNEYVEAAIEGGAARLVLTLGLAAGAVGVAAAGAVRWRRRTVGPLLAGAVFGLTATAAHSAVDFGVHIPAVAVLLAAVAGQAVAAARDTQEEGRGRGREAPDDGRLTGWAAGPVCALLIGSGAAFVWSGWTAVRVEGLTLAARAAVPPLPAGGGPRRREPTAADLAAAVGRWAEAVRLTPDDPDLWNELSGAHLLAAAGDPGAAAGERHLFAALAAAREARACGPLLPGPHARLGVFAGVFARGEPATAHLDRAKRVAPADPTVWALSGVARFRAGDRGAAVADWRHAVGRSRGSPAAVLAAARPYLSADEVRDHLLPDDPPLWVASADVLFPDPRAGRGARRPFLARADGLWAAAEPPAGDPAWAAWAQVRADLGDRAGAEAVWRRAAGLAPAEARFKDGLAAALEADERYDEAVELLTWLDARGAGYRDRLDAARHALELRRQIRGSR